MQRHLIDQQEIIHAIAEMGGFAESELAMALSIITKSNDELYGKIEGSDRALDELDRKVNDLCHVYVSKHGPMANDLRGIFAFVKISTHLERIGDYAKNIAKRGNVVDHDRLLSAQAAVQRMGQTVLKSLSTMMNALALRDVALAKQVWRADAAIDAHYDSVFAEIVQTIAVRPASVADGTHLLFIARNLERIGDHISNIAETLCFWIDGERLDEEREFYENTSEFTQTLEMPANMPFNDNAPTTKKVS